MNKTPAGTSLSFFSFTLYSPLLFSLFFSSIAVANAESLAGTTERASSQTALSASATQNKHNQTVIETTKQLQSIIPAFTATYSILHKSDPIGEGIRQLQYLDDGTMRYSYKTDLEWFIISDRREETSIINIENNAIKPIHYTFKREGTGKNKSAEWQFDAKNNHGRNIKKKRDFDLDFSKPLQDTLSYHLQHRITMLNEPQKKSYIYPVVKLSGTIKDYEYKYDGEEELILPYGLIKTIRLKRETGSKKKRITYAWFAPELNYLLVRLYQTKGGTEQFEAQLKALSYDK